jgi:hypothetical protein
MSVRNRFWGGLAAATAVVMLACGSTSSPIPGLIGEPKTTLGGRWVGRTNITLDACVENDSIALDLQEAEGKVLGTYTWRVVTCPCCGPVTGSDDPVSGTAADGTLILVTGGRYPNWTYSSTFDASRMSGKVKGPDGRDRGTWEAEKQ